MTSDKSDKGFTVVDRRGSAEEAKPAPETPPPAEKPAREVAEIDFATFTMSLASSALIHLGELQPPGGEARHDLGLAKQTIDILGMLAEKTRGNLTSDEAKLLEHLLYDLRLKYVEAKKRG
jgi:hypothetical protein